VSSVRELLIGGTVTCVETDEKGRIVKIELSTEKGLAVLVPGVDDGEPVLVVAEVRSGRASRTQVFASSEREPAMVVVVRAPIARPALVHASR